MTGLGAIDLVLGPRPGSFEKIENRFWRPEEKQPIKFRNLLLALPKILFLNFNLLPSGLPS